MPSTVSFRSSKLRMCMLLACWHPDPKPPRPPPPDHTGEKGLPPLHMPLKSCELAPKPGVPMTTSSLLVGPVTPYIALTPEISASQQAGYKVWAPHAPKLVSESPKSPREEREPPTQSPPQLLRRLFWPLPCFPGWGQRTGTFRAPRLSFTSGQLDIK